MHNATARINPVGENAILVRFDDHLTVAANEMARSFRDAVAGELGRRIIDATSNLVSTLVRYDPTEISFDELRQELSLIVSRADLTDHKAEGKTHEVHVSYGGQGLAEVCKELNLSENEFIEKHSGSALRALSLGFSPGFLYLGLHDRDLVVSRRKIVQDGIGAGAILFAAGQSAITSRPIRTGWHVIGYTYFRNFDPAQEPPVTVLPGDTIKFEAV